MPKKGSTKPTTTAAVQSTTSATTAPNFIINDFSQTPNFSKLEEQIADYWEDEQIFAQSLAQTKGKPNFVFYDGPPFATGLPHYGHLVASTTKDVFPRFQTMRGKYVERIWGWDCHGLPIENIVEKELELKDKPALESFGVGKFCEGCRDKVQLYADAWRKTVKRLGRFVDMDHAYKTMDPEFMNTEWSVFKQLWDKGLIYQGYKSMHICPRCSTPLSNFEVTLGYKDVTDLSVFVLFELTDPTPLGLKGKVEVLSWTTTPWTLPGNFLLAINPQADYVVVETNDPSSGAPTQIILAKSRIKEVLGDCDYQKIATFPGSKLLGLNYQPLMPYFANTPKAFRIVAGEFVTMDEGTGIVHIAPAFGEDDFQVGQNEGVEIIHHVDMEGKMVTQVTDFAGMEVRSLEDPQAIDVAIIKYLAAHGTLWKKQKVKHSYPHCWRCDHALLNYATGSFFVKVTAFKDQLIAANKKVNWLPEHFRDGRMGDWLANARDWAISRNRYWGTPIPLWQNDDGEFICVGSSQELEKLSGQKVSDLHKHFVDDIVITKNGKQYHRVPEVFDCWFESGSMPYFGAGFPADFISEGQDQTRGWFYTLLVLATALKGKSAFKNVIVNGVILAADGKKMSKKLKNYPDPADIFDKYGADALRLYLMTSPVMKAENLNFSEEDVGRLRRQVIVTAWNIFAFGKTSFDYQHVTPLTDFKQLASAHFLDRYLITRLQELIASTTKDFEAYEIIKVGRSLIEFVDELSTFYLRLSRERLKQDRVSQQVLTTTLNYLALLLAPIMPFFAELLYHNLGGELASIHLERWPETLPNYQLNSQLLAQADTLKKVLTLGNSERKKLGLKIRQPLPELKIAITKQLWQQLSSPQIQAIIKQQLNIKTITWIEAVDDQETQVQFNTQLTPELLAEGQARELMREIATARKKAGLKASDDWTYTVPTIPAEWQAEIEAHTHTKLTVA